MKIIVDVVDLEEDGFTALRSRNPEIVFEVIDPHGPGGGTPVVELSGERDHLRHWLITEYTNGDVADAEYYLDH